MAESQTKVGIPTMRGMGSAMVDYGVGLGGGLLYALIASLFGSGFWGGLIGAAIAGATIKGQRGTAIATMLGFMSIMGGFMAGSASASSAASPQDQRGVM